MKAVALGVLFVVFMFLAITSFAYGWSVPPP